MKVILRVFLFFLAVPLLYVMTACGGGGGGGGGGNGGLGDIVACNSLTNDGCEEGLSCEYTSSGETGCFESIALRGTVFDLATTAAIEGARVVALDANGAVASTVTVTDAEGNYELEVSVTRDEEGNPAAGQSVTLRADAAGYQTFPGGVRQALPVDLTAPVEVDDQLVVDVSLTDIGLIALEAGAGTASIYGTAELPEDTYGTMIVAELSATEGYTAITDIEGYYRIFNLSAGTYAVSGYSQGVTYDQAAATLAAGEEAEVNLALSGDAPATLIGKVNIVNPGDGNATSIILVVKSTFDDTLIRGEMPPGLRAPSSGLAPNVTSGGVFTIEGIPPGTYVILAAFENDFLVRDPDTCIGGTAILHQAFSSGATVDLSSNPFKITGSLDVLSPGATGPETVTTATPAFSWVDDSSEDQYDITLFDTFGNVIWTKTIAGSSGSTNASVTYDGETALESGMYYQFKAVSINKSGCELSQTEDLMGVFVME